MIPGSSTITTPMLPPASKVPANSPGIPKKLRMPMPKASTSSPYKTMRSGMKRDARRGASGAKMPKHSTGSVVSTPASADDMPVAARIDSRMAATLDKAGRRLIPTKNSAITSRIWLRRVGA